MLGYDRHGPLHIYADVHHGGEPVRVAHGKTRTPRVALRSVRLLNTQGGDMERRGLFCRRARTHIRCESTWAHSANWRAHRWCRVVVGQVHEDRRHRTEHGVV